MSDAPKVLVVEDEPLIALDLESELTERGFEVVGPAGRVDKALELVTRTELSIAVLDINLGGHDSFEIAKALELQEVPFVFLSGDTTKLPELYKDRPVLSKPIDYEALARTLRMHLG
jgi:DNA-binding response OmpR family regulator